VYAITTFWSGVDLFFCISGFVIAASLLREARAGAFFDWAVPFWIKRAWRIWPAAFVWLAIGIGASKFFNASGVFGGFTANIADGVAAVAQVANFHFLGCWYYHQGACGNQAIYWSLSLEEQFYFVFPFVLFLLPRRWLCAGLAAVIALQVFRHRPMGTPGWVTRTDAICFGVLIALAGGSAWKRKLYPYVLKSKEAATVFSLALIFLLAAIPTGQVVWFDTGLLAVVCAVLVFVASYDAGFILPIPYLAPLLLWVGSRSFAIYLTHCIAFWSTRELFYRWRPGAVFDSTNAAAFAAVGFGLLILFSESTYRWIEAPLRDKGRRIAQDYRNRGGAAVSAREPPADAPAASAVGAIAPKSSAVSFAGTDARGTHAV
jgi:peptidoglycan/LPS O-acetylase OafA/YrhL